MTKRKTTDPHPLSNTAVIIASIAIALIFVRSGALDTLITASAEVRFLSVFIAGLFFTSALTISTATVALVNMIDGSPLWEIAIIGAAGAMVGDFILFRFFRGAIAHEIVSLFPKSRFKRLHHLLRTRAFSWALPFIGALIIASPLPDEIGLAMMGVTHFSTIKFLAASFTGNVLGILMLGGVVQLFS